MTDAKQHRVCPWWLGYFLMSPFFRGGQKPDEILAPYVHEGMAVLEPGSGMGFFTIDLARMVGKSGRVIATDIQPKMLDRLKRRAAKAGVLDRVDARLAPADSMNIHDLSKSLDFTLAFAVVHEFPSAARFFAELGEASKAGASVLLAEPNGHVNPPEFDSELQAAREAGFEVVDRPSIRKCNAALLKKT